MATRNVTIKMAVQGESEFRAALKRINEQITADKSALELVNAQYKNNANSMEALSAKYNALNRLVETQKTKVEECRRGLENAQQATAEYEQRNELLKIQLAAVNRSLEELKTKSGDTSRQEKILTEEQTRLNEELTRNEASLIAAQRGVAKWTTDLNKAELQLVNLDGDLKLTGEYLNEARNASDGCATSIDRFGKTIPAASGATKQMAEDTQDAKEAVEALAAAMVASGLKRAVEEVAGALNECVSAAGDFEYAMATVKAIAGASAEEMDALRAQALQYGQSTVYSASEVTEAYQHMAMAGWTVQEMMAGLPGVLNLATASGENLAMVSGIVTDGLTAFGMKAGEAGRYADVLAKAAASSNTNVALMGESFRMAATTAGTLGFSIEDVATALGIMANNGMKGTMAGTALSTMLTRLTGSNASSRDAMKALDLSMFNMADGSARELGTVLEELRAAFAGLTDEQKAQYAFMLAGQRGMKGLLAIINASAEDWNGLSDAIHSATGAAQTMSDIKLDTYAGKVKLLNNAFDALKITVGDQLKPAMQGIVETGTDLIKGADEFVQENQWLIPLVAGLTTGFALLVVGLTAYTVWTKIAKAATVEFAAALAAHPAIAVAIALTALTAAVYAYIKSEAYLTETERELKHAREDLNKAFADAEETYQGAEDAANAAAATAGKYIDRLSELERQGELTEEQQAEYAGLIEQVKALLPGVNVELDKQTGFLKGGAEALREQVQGWRELAIAQAMQEKMKTEAAAYVEAQTRVNQAEREQEELIIRRRNAQVELNWAQAEYDRLMADQTNHGPWGADQAIMDAAQRDLDAARQKVEDLDGAIERNGRAIAAAQAELEQAKAEMDQTAGAMAELSATTGGATDQTENMVKSLAELRAELRFAYPEITKLANEAGFSTEALARKLDESGKTAADWADAVNTAAGKVINGFQQISTDLEMSLDEMAENLAFNVEAYAEWQENLEILRQAAAASGEEGAALFVEYLASMGPSAAEQVAAAAADTAAAFEQFGPLVEEAYTQGILTVDQEMFAEIGKNAQAGLTAGLEDPEQRAAMKTAAQNAAGDVETAMKDRLAISSPSRVTEEVGKNADRGLISGVGALRGLVANAGTAAGESLIDGMIRGVQSRTGALYEAVRSAVENAVSAARSAAETVGKPAASDGAEVKSEAAYFAAQAMAYGAEADRRKTTGGNVSLSVTVNAAPGMDEKAVARHVKTEIFDELARAKGAR